MKKFYVFILILVLGACEVNTAPSNFYILASTTKDKTEVVSNKYMAVSVDVTIPEYIDRPQIVTQGTTDTELNMSEFNRWLENIRTSSQRIIAENLSYYMPKAKVKPATMGIRNPDYRVVVNIDEFTGRLGEKVILNAWWNIIDKSNEVIFFEDSSFSAVVGDTYVDLVQKQSDLINELSLVIAKKLARLK